MEDYAVREILFRHPRDNAERQRGVTTWRSDNVEAEQLERAEKARYWGEIGRDTPENVSYIQRGHHRLHAMRWREFECGESDTLLGCTLSNISL